VAVTSSAPVCSRLRLLIDIELTGPDRRQNKSVYFRF
jgi:hypothetical protein